MREVLEGVVVTLTAMTLGAGVVLAVGRWALKHLGMPWLEAHVIAPAREAAKNSAETRRQVTVNNHVSDPPTLLDTVHTMRGDLTEAREAFHLAGLMFEGHIGASEEDRAALWEAVARLEGVTTSLANSVDTLTESLTS